MTAYLITVQGLRGPEQQIAYKEVGRYVGHPPGWKPLAERQLPDVSVHRNGSFTWNAAEPWSLEDAIAWHYLNPEQQAAA